MIDASVFDSVKRACAQLTGGDPAAGTRSCHTARAARRQARVAASVPQRTNKYKKVRVVWTEDDVGAYDGVRRLFHKRYLGKMS